MTPSPPTRDQLKRHYNLRQYWMDVDLQDLLTFDAQLADKLMKLPAEYLPLVSLRWHGCALSELSCILHVSLRLLQRNRQTTSHDHAH